MIQAPLSSFGIFHTLISVLALALGLSALWRWRRITATGAIGTGYVALTALSSLTGLFIFHHGGFGKPHVLSILTLVFLALAVIAARSRLFGRYSERVEALLLSTTIFFHLVPGVTETSTRLPIGHPLFSSPDDPGLQAVIFSLLVLLLLGLYLQYRFVLRDIGAAHGRTVTAPHYR
jgi:uncharacterized membrane protein